MTDPDLPVSEDVVIRCPACGASEGADPAVLTGGPTIVCRKCGETWPTIDRARGRSAGIGREGSSIRRNDVLEAELRPLVGYSNGVSRAWAAKIDGDILPAERQPRRLPGAVAALAALAFVGMFFGAREAAVHAVPDLAGLYSAVGLPVNLAGLVIDGLAAERRGGGETVIVTLFGTIRNVSSEKRPAPPLRARLYRIDGAPAGTRGFEAPAKLILPGEAVSFSVDIGSVPSEAEEIVVRFQAPAEQVAAALDPARQP